MDLDLQDFKSRTSTGSSIELEKVGIRIAEKLPDLPIMQNRSKSRVGDPRKTEK